MHGPLCCAAAAIGWMAAGRAAHAPGGQGPAPGQDAPRVEYRVEYEPEAGGAWLGVHVHATGLGDGGSVGLQLPNWGEWVEVDSLYLRSMRSEPPARRDAASPSEWAVESPQGWEGSLDVSYRIPFAELGSRACEHRGLLPWEVRGAAGYAACTSLNTLMRVVRGGESVRACTITLAAPPGFSIATGWGGVSDGPQRVEADVMTESPILFGIAPKVARGTLAGAPCEVVQFSAKPDVTGQLLDVGTRVCGAYRATTGLALDRPLRVFVTDKGGGQKVDGGLMMQAADTAELTPYYTQLMAHELFHLWLGGHAREADESLTWFQEGFTDYLSIWHMAAAGLATPEWFARRMAELDEAARASAAYGHAAFGDRAVNWRDGDGPNETLAYKGGAVLALAMDVELRRRGDALPRMVADLAREGGGTYTPESLRAWAAAHGLDEFWRAYVERPALPELRAVLEGAGFALVQRDAPLTYTGIQTDGAPFGNVTAIDPDGPAAGSGLAVGDRITGLWPTRAARPRVAETVATPYRYGLEWIEPGAETVNVGVSRAGEERKVTLKPRPMEGGRLEAYEARERAKEFLAVDAR